MSGFRLGLGFGVWFCFGLVCGNGCGLVLAWGSGSVLFWFVGVLCVICFCRGVAWICVELGCRLWRGVWVQFWFGFVFDM